MSSRNRNKSHRRPTDRLADGLGVGCIMLVALDVRLYELRRHQLYRVAHVAEPPCPIVGAATTLHADQAGLDAREELHHFPPLERPLDPNFTSLIYTVDLESILCQVDANCRNLHDDASLDVVVS